MLLTLPTPEGLAAEADRFGAFPHPREMLSLIGHRTAEAEFLNGLRAGRLHHAWLITGEEGIGKATFAYRAARFLLAHPGGAPAAATDLSVPADHPVAHQIASGGHPDLSVIRRTLNDTRKGFYQDIRVDDVRKGLEIFNKTAAYGGYRICIVDSCDELNANSANALLKTLEEPPAQGLFLLVATRPGGLLPTIRSRCRTLPLMPLDEGEIREGLAGMPGIDEEALVLAAKAATAGRGSMRRALASLDPKAIAFVERLERILTHFPRVESREVDGLAELLPGRAGDEAFARFCDHCESWMSDRIRSESDVDLARLAQVWSNFGEKRREVEIYNLDRRPFAVAMLADMAASVSSGAASARG